MLMTIVKIMALGLFSTVALAKKMEEFKLLSCLGQEEERIHKRRTHGVISSLNLEVVNELAQMPDLIVREAYLGEICSHQNFSATLVFLEKLLRYQSSLFVLSDEYMVRNQQRAFIKDLVRRAPDFFFRYMILLQGLTPDAQCLTRELPGLAKILEDYQHLQEVNQYDFYRQNEKKALEIFARLKRFDQIYDRCEKEQQRKARQTPQVVLPQR